MSIPDRAVEAAVQAFENETDRQGAVDDGDAQFRDTLRAALEAAEPYLTGPQIHIESGLRQAVELLLGAYIDVHGGKVGAPRSWERAYYSVSVDLQNALNRHPEVKS